MFPHLSSIIFAGLQRSSHLITVALCSVDQIMFIFAITKEMVTCRPSSCFDELRYLSHAMTTLQIWTLQLIAFIKLTFRNVKYKLRFAVDYSKHFSHKNWRFHNWFKTTHYYLVWQWLSMWCHLTGVNHGLFFPNHFIIKYGYWFACMRSFVFLSHKGNILAIILKELLVENPLSSKINLGQKTLGLYP